MPKYLALHVVAIAGLVVAVTFLIFQSRALTLRLQALESASLRVEKSAPAPEAPRRSAPMHPEELRPQVPPERGEAAPPPARTESAPAPSAPSEAPVLTPVQEQAVAKHVDRILAEKYGHLPKIPSPEELEKTLAKELNLTESQKARIHDLLERKRDEVRALFESDKGPGLPLKKALEIDQRYDLLIKNELDAAQQAKYDQLKKDGKIGGGITVQIDATEKE